MKERKTRPGPTLKFYGAEVISIAVNPRTFGNDEEDNLTIAEGFVRHYYDLIKEKSCYPKKGYNTTWI